MNGEVVIDPVEGKRGRALFVDTGRRFASREPHAVPQLRGEQLEPVSYTHLTLPTICSV